MKLFATTVLLLAATTTSTVSGTEQHLRTTPTRRWAEEIHQDEAQNDAQNFWARQLIADLDSMVVTKMPTTNPTKKPTPAPQHSLYPSFDATSRNPGTLDPTTSGTTPNTKSPTSMKITDIDNSDLIYTDIANIASYTTFCQTGKYAKIQIVGNNIDQTVHCITNFEGAEIGFGYEEDYPNHPIIKLNVEPPTTCGGDDDEDEEEDNKNYCGFRGKQKFQQIVQIVDTLENEGTINADKVNVASYTTYCQKEEYTNVEIVSFHGAVICVTSLPGGTINLIDEPSGTVFQIVDVDPPSSCDGIPGGRNVLDSNPCGFDGVATTVHPNFNDDTQIVNRIENTGTINANKVDVASYTTYCQKEEYTNMKIVGLDGSVTCVKSLPGGTITLIDEPSGTVLQTVDVDPRSSCDDIPGGINVIDSVPCGFDGVAITVSPN